MQERVRFVVVVTSGRNLRLARARFSHAAANTPGLRFREKRGLCCCALFLLGPYDKVNSLHSWFVRRFVRRPRRR